MPLSSMRRIPKGFASLVALACALAGGACEEKAQPPYAAPAVPPGIPPAVQAAESDLERNLRLAREAYEANPTDEDAIIWYGRRLAYTGDHVGAVAVYSKGLELYPESYKLLRHRGHRMITLRRFEEGSRDLARAARFCSAVPDEVEPDGMPNPSGIPRSTAHSNIHYHLALSWYLRGEFEQALKCYREGEAACSVNDDLRCAHAYWTYLTLTRLGLDEQAAELLDSITADMEILENHAYHDLLRMYRGELSPDEVLAKAKPSTVDYSTRGYGVANLYLKRGDRDAARSLLERIVADTSQQAAFGYIAAEADLRRMQ
jgi:tetratricopeptide (TPR) repeat protein